MRAICGLRRSVFQVTTPQVSYAELPASHSLVSQQLETRKSSLSGPFPSEKGLSNQAFEVHPSDFLDSFFQHPKIGNRRTNSLDVPKEVTQRCQQALWGSHHREA
jgi:hypothetical protein